MFGLCKDSTVGSPKYGCDDKHHNVLLMISTRKVAENDDLEAFESILKTRHLLVRNGVMIEFSRKIFKISL